MMQNTLLSSAELREKLYQDPNFNDGFAGPTVEWGGAEEPSSHHASASASIADAKIASAAMGAVPRHRASSPGVDLMSNTTLSTVLDSLPVPPEVITLSCAIVPSLDAKQYKTKDNDIFSPPIPILDASGNPISIAPTEKSVLVLATKCASKKSVAVRNHMKTHFDVGHQLTTLTIVPRVLLAYALEGSFNDTFGKANCWNYKTSQQPLTNQRHAVASVFGKNSSIPYEHCGELKLIHLDELCTLAASVGSDICEDAQLYNLRNLVQKTPFIVASDADYALCPAAHELLE